MTLHRCDNPRCVRPSHLFEGTQLENVVDRHSKGRSGAPRGEQSGRARLTDAQVREIRAAYANGETQVSIAKRMGLYQGRVSAVVLRRSWRHVA
jgi:hypothetical protein